MYKNYLIKILFLFLLTTIFICSFNYLVDPYGYNSRIDKFVKNLAMFNKPNVTNSRLNSNGYYYLIGSSRTSRINPQIIEKITNKSTHNIKIDGATLSENLLLANEVKAKNSFFIYSFDAFSLNSNRQKFSEIRNRYNIYEDELNNSVFFSKYYNSDITIRSLQHLIKVIKKEKTNKQYLYENSLTGNFSLNEALYSTGVLNNLEKSNFTNYFSYSEDAITSLAELGKEGDIFIIFPKYYRYYDLFSKYQDIEKKYFSAIKTLVNNTEAQVWSFYGPNAITMSINNFNDNGWHFKPQISNIIFNQVFDVDYQQNNEGSGVLITKDNVINYLFNMSNKTDIQVLDND